MINLTFTEAETAALNYDRYHHPHPRVQRKMEALWLKSQGLPHNEICRLTGIGSRLEAGRGIREISRDTRHGVNTVQKVKKALAG